MSTLFAKFKPLLTLLVGFFAAVGALSLAHVGPAQAQSPGVNLAQLVAAVNTLKSQQAADEQTITSQGSTITSQGSTISALQGSLTTETSRAKAAETNLASKTDLSALQGRVSTLETKTAPLSLSGTDLTFTGVNVHIVNGQGSTETQNGLGNLIVGYNESRTDSDFGMDARTGSHNIVTGLLNNFTSSGGIIGGYGNSLGGVEEFAVGAFNIASGHQSTVSGGFGNTASGRYASVSGGDLNAASGRYASVSGGIENAASGDDASVSGGSGNTASGGYASVSGGSGNTASGSYAWVSGGFGNTASGGYASVSGGDLNAAQGTVASVSGGYSVTQSTQYGWAAGSQAAGGVTHGNFASP